MTYTVYLSFEAENDLRDIFAYIAFQLHAPETARQQVNRLLKMILSLDEMPFRFRRFDPQKEKHCDLRIVTVDKYCVLYVPNEQQKTVTIVRVMYGGRNLSAYFGDSAE